MSTLHGTFCKQKIAILTKKMYLCIENGEVCTERKMKKLLIETYGCQMNVADSEVVASVMGMAGYEVTTNIDEADAVFLNTCSVRDNAEQKIISRLEYFYSLQKKGRRLIVGVLGCMAQRVKEELIEKHHVDIVAGPDAYMSLPDQHRTLHHRNLSRGRAQPHLRTTHLRLRQHHARLQ